MNNILKKICEDKKLEIEILKKKCSLKVSLTTDPYWES